MHPFATQHEQLVADEARVPSEAQKLSHEPEAGPSTTTSAELEALQIFHDANSAYAPHLVDFKQTTQGPNGLLPGGYLTFTVMTKMPGESLHNLNFWGMPTEEREEIVKEFSIALR